MITGATSGLGRALAEELAKAGHHLLLHGRDPEQLAAVAAVTGGETYRADLADLAATRRLAAEVTSRHERLDVLVNNAAVGFHVAGKDRSLSADGLELRLAVNYLAPVLLTRELLPLLRAAAPSRIVNVASAGQQLFDFDDPGYERDFTEAGAYMRSKLAQVSYTADIAEELAGTGVTANSVHPATFMPTRGTQRAGMNVVDSLETGVAAVRRLIEGADVAEVSGRYFHSEAEALPRYPEALDPAYRRRLADLTRTMLESAGV